MVYPREKLSPAVFPVFPEDILIDIITRLPVKSLLRFKCVSKHFYAIVDSPYFIRKHHNYAIKSKTNHKIILHSHKAHNFSYHSIDVHLPDQALTLEPPLKSYNGDGTILGSVHGLLCIKVSTKDIIIWNPATKNYRKLPKTLDYEYSTMYFYGFGYNPVFDDYKILRIKQFWDRGTSSYKHIISVYSSRSNSWQFLQDCPYLFSCHLNDQGCGIIICGELLWCVNNSTGYKSPFLIAAFDLATNDFSLVAHPDALNNDFNRTNKKLIDMAISELGGDLCVICYYMHLQVDIWVMRNYRVKESWTKLFSVSKQGILPTFYTPLAYSEKRDEIMVLTGDKSLFWYNKKENKPKIINVHDCPSDGKVQMVICVESLAPPNGRWREE